MEENSKSSTWEKIKDTVVMTIIVLAITGSISYIFEEIKKVDSRTNSNKDKIHSLEKSILELQIEQRTIRKASEDAMQEINERIDQINQGDSPKIPEGDDRNLHKNFLKNMDKYDMEQRQYIPQQFKK